MKTNELVTHLLAFIQRYGDREITTSQAQAIIGVALDNIEPDAQTPVILLTTPPAITD